MKYRVHWLEYEDGVKTVDVIYPCGGFSETDYFTLEEAQEFMEDFRERNRIVFLKTFGENSND